MSKDPVPIVADDIMGDYFLIIMGKYGYRVTNDAFDWS